MNYEKHQTVNKMLRRLDFWASMRYLSAMHYGMALKEKDTHNIKRWDRIANFCSKRYYNAKYDLDWYIKLKLID